MGQVGQRWAHIAPKSLFSFICSDIFICSDVLQTNKINNCYCYNFMTNTYMTTSEGQTQNEGDAIHSASKSNTGGGLQDETSIKRARPDASPARQKLPVPELKRRRLSSKGKCPVDMEMRAKRQCPSRQQPSSQLSRAGCCPKP